MLYADDAVHVKYCGENSGSTEFLGAQSSGESSWDP